MFRLKMLLFIVLINPFTSFANNDVAISVVMESLFSEDLIIKPLYVYDQKQWIVLDTGTKIDRYKPLERSWYIKEKILFTADEIEPINGYHQNFNLYLEAKIKNIDINRIQKNQHNTFNNWRKTPKLIPTVALTTKNSQMVPADAPQNSKINNTDLVDQVLSIVKYITICNKKIIKIKALPHHIQVYNQYSVYDRHFVSIGLKEKYKYINNCDGITTKEEEPLWFEISSDNTINFIGYELEWLSVFDANKDGIVEMLFWHNGYNEDGFLLYDAMTKKSYRYYWRYH